MTETGRFLAATDRQTGGDNPYRAVDATPALRRPSAQKPGGPRRAAPNAQLVSRLPLLYHSGDTETNGPAGANPSPTPMQPAVARRETPPPSLPRISGLNQGACKVGDLGIALCRHPRAASSVKKNGRRPLHLMEKLQPPLRARHDERLDAAVTGRRRGVYRPREGRACWMGNCIPYRT